MALDISREVEIFVLPAIVIKMRNTELQVDQLRQSLVEDDCQGAKKKPKEAPCCFSFNATQHYHCPR